MRILHVITGLHDGGAEGALYRLCKYDGHNTHIVVSLLSGGKYEVKFFDIGIQTFSLNFNTSLGILKCLNNYRNLLASIRPDIVQTWLYHADFFVSLASIFIKHKRIYWNIRNYNTSSDALKFSTRTIVFVNAILSRYVPHRIISVSENSTFHHIEIGYDSTKFVTIPNGCEFKECFEVSSEILELRNNTEFLIGMVARYDPQKDHKNLLNSLIILRELNVEFKFLLVGTRMDYDNSDLVKMIEKCGLQDYVKLLGRRDDVECIMRVLDLHVLASLGEAFPNVLVEAMSCNTLCVATNVGDSDKIIDGNGWVVQPRSPEQLASAILDANKIFLTNKRRWEALGVKARKSVMRRFTMDNMVKRYNDVWRG